MQQRGADLLERRRLGHAREAGLVVGVRGLHLGVGHGRLRHHLRLVERLGREAPGLRLLLDQRAADQHVDRLAAQLVLAGAHVEQLRLDELVHLGELDRRARHGRHGRRWRLVPRRRRFRRHLGQGGARHDECERHCAPDGSADHDSS
jgi:hypothetical protein